MATRKSKASHRLEYERERQQFAQHMVSTDYAAYAEDCRKHGEEPVTRAEYRALAVSGYPSYEEWLRFNADVL